MSKERQEPDTDEAAAPRNLDADRIMQATARLAASVRSLVEELYHVYDLQAELHMKAAQLLGQLKEVERQEAKR